MNLDDIKARHQRDRKSPGGCCEWCGCEWPCDASVLLGKLEAVREWRKRLGTIEALDRILGKEE